MGSRRRAARGLAAVAGARLAEPATRPAGANGLSSGSEPPAPATRTPVRGRLSGGPAVLPRSLRCRRAAPPAGGERAAVWAEPRPVAALGSRPEPG